MSTPLLALAFHLAGINPATPTEKEFLEEVSKFVELSQNLGAIRTYSDEERAEIHTWIAFSQKISQEDLQKLDSLLVKRSFLVGTRITAADILTFAAIHDQKLVELVLQLAHVARWFDHVQHSVYPNVVPVTPITHRAFVFPWLESSSSTPAPAAATETKPPAAPENKKADAPKKEEKVENKKADKKEKAEKAEKPAEKKKEEAPKAATEAKPEEAKPLSADGLDPSKLEIRVGQIVKCWNHPESDKLLCEEIDLNEGSIRTIASGLRNFYTAEQMQGRKVLVLANLKERPMAGFKSQGMVLCAIGEGHSVVKLLEPPASANVGDRVDIAGFVGEPTPATQVAKKKIFESLAPFFRTNADGLPTWNNIPFTIKGENCVATLPNAVVS